MKQQNTTVWHPVLLGADLNAYSVASALYEATGVCSVLFGRDFLGLTSTARAVRACRVPGLDRPEVLLDTLTRYAAHHRTERLVLFPCADWYAAATEEIREKIAGEYAFLLPEKEQYRTLSDKAKFYRLLADAGLPYPRTEVISFDTPPGLSDFSGKISYPAVLKPADSTLYWRTPFPGMKKVYFPEDPLHAKQIAEVIFASGYRGKLLLQERIRRGTKPAGAAVLTVFSGADGRCVRAVQGDVLLEERGGTSTGNYAAILTRAPDAIALALIRFLDGMGFTGIANFDILYGDGGAYVLECNPRQGRSNDYCRAAGVNLPSLVLSALDGERLTPDFSSREVFWHALPAADAIRFATDRDLTERAGRLLSAGADASPFCNPSESAPALHRRVYLALHALRQRARLSHARPAEVT